MIKFGYANVEEVVRALLLFDARRATKYSSPTRVVSAARVLFDGKIHKRDNRATIVLKIGAPNYDERAFIKACRKAGEPFPIKKVQLKFPPK